MSASVFRNFTLSVWLLTVSMPVARAELPQLGDPSLQGFSTLEEKKLGQAFYQTLRASVEFVDDIALNHYLTSLGEKLLTHSDAAANDFKFFIIESDAINAFAGPDAHIGINSGLILTARNESELAGVIAHEIAHVSQRHIARMINESDSSTAITFGALLAAILVGAQNPEAAQAILATGIAGSYQSSINFTRQNEYEADRVGIGILARAGIDPEGMVGFFKLLLERSHGLELEYLRTHPLSINRVSEAEHRAANLRINTRSDSEDFRFARARLRVLTANNVQDIVRATPADTAVQRYQRALALLQQHKLKAAIAQLQQARQQSRHPWISLALAEAYERNGGTNKARTELKTLAGLYPGYLPVTLAYAKLLLDHNLDINRAITLLKHQLQTGDKPVVYKMLARAYYLNGQTAAALEATGDQYLQQGYHELALQQYDNALNQSSLSTTAKKRLLTKIKRLKPE